MMKLSAGVGRWILLALLGGHLLFRREFAHRNLADIFSLLGRQCPGFLNYAYITEVLLVLLFPCAAAAAWNRRIKNRELASSGKALNESLGAGLYLGILFLLWGLAHAALAFYRGGDMYLILRQSAMAVYVLVFLYAILLFGDLTGYIRGAVLFGIVISIACAVADYLGWLGPNQHFLESTFGQETLPIAILGLALFVVYWHDWLWRAMALIALGFVAWRQSNRLQSVVPISLAGALAAYILLGICLAFRSQTATLKRGILCLVLFAGLFIAHRSMRKTSLEDTGEIRAWSPSIYLDLFNVYERTGPPEDPGNRVFSRRPPFVPVSDPEVYKLNAVYEAANNVSIRNNMWRFLVWQRMGGDWWKGGTWCGADLGKPWFYEALYHSQFHYGEDREGLDPHNSHLNLLYRFGLVGFLIYLSILVSVLYFVWRALNIRMGHGDALLEGLALYFFYTMVFSGFTVSLEGPSYSMPFWFTLGLLYARARNVEN